MMGKPQKSDARLFYVGLNLEDRVPADHPLRKVAGAVDFGFVRGRVAHLYGFNGNESVDPTVVLKLLFLVFFERVRSERELMRQLPLRLDWLWFCGLDLDDEVPDHSVLSKARRRWGLEVFEQVFRHVLERCVQAGLVDGATVYADSTVLKADASVDSRVPRALWNQLEAGASPEDEPPSRTPPPPEDTQQMPPPPVGQFNARTVSTTDPDAATTRHRSRGVTLGTDPAVAAGDSMYGGKENYAALRRRGIKPYLKPRTTRRGKGHWTKRLPDICDRAVAVRLMARRQTGAEGRFADAHTRHEHRRCRWRRRWRVQVQCYLVGIVQNIKKLTRWATRPGPAVSAAMTSVLSPLRVAHPDLARPA